MTVSHSTPSDGSFTSAGAAAWDAAHTLTGNLADWDQKAAPSGSVVGTAGLTAGRVTISSAGAVVADDANLLWDSTNNRITIIGTGSSYDGAANGPLQIQVDSGGTGFVVSLSSTEYTRFISGGSFKGMLGTGTNAFHIQNAGDVEIRPGGAAMFKFTTSNGCLPSAAENWDIGSTALTIRTVYARDVVTTPKTVATLPAAVAGRRSYVTDANSSTFGAAVVGGGANKVPVVSDGTGWFIG